MLARTLYIPKSLFRYLPNPVMHRWDPRAFSLRHLMTAFRDELAGLEAPVGPLPIVERAHRLLSQCGPNFEPREPQFDRVDCLGALSETLAATDRFLTEQVAREAVLDVAACHFTVVLEQLNLHSRWGLLGRLSNQRSPERERAFMSFYFAVVRPAVTREADVGNRDGGNRTTSGVAEGVVITPSAPNEVAGANLLINEKDN
jgi:hypothetical protein